MNATTQAEILELEPAARQAQPLATTASTALAPHSPAAMMMAAMSQGASLEQVEKMMDLQDRWERKEAEKAYNSAFAAFKAEAVRIVKGRKVTDGPLRRANRLSRNTPQVAQVAPTQDSARMHLRQTSRRSFAGSVAAAA